MSERTVVPRLHNMGVSFRTGMKISLRYNELAPVGKSNASFERDGEILKNNRSENGTGYFAEIRRARIKLILQIGTVRLGTYLLG